MVLFTLHSGMAAPGDLGMGGQMILLLCSNSVLWDAHDGGAQRAVGLKFCHTVTSVPGGCLLQI